MPGPEKFATLSLEDQSLQTKALTADIIDGYPGGRKALAYALGRSYITVCRWCNEFLENHCIPPQGIIRLYHERPDPRLVQFICRNTNHLAVPVPEEVAGLPEIALAVGVSSKEFGELLQQVGQSLSGEGAGGVSITPGELDRIRKEAHEAMSSIAALLKAVEVVAEDKK